MDELAARRSIAGAVIVHGLHTLFWLLDVLASSSFRPSGIQSLDVRFPKPIYIGDEVTLTLQSANDREIRIWASVGARTVAKVRLVASPPREDPSPNEGTIRPYSVADAPAELEFDTLLGRAGTVDFAASMQSVALAFPGAASLLGAPRVRGLATCSRLVGMTCPGLRSIDSHLFFKLTDENLGGSVSYRVLEADERFRLVRMEVKGAGLEGSIEAFSPPEPPDQPSMAKVSGLVRSGEFSYQTALIIGGSRGLGELSAKIVAAGGGQTILTYATGRAEADRVADEIRTHGGQAATIAYDVTKPAASQLEKLNHFSPTHVYYFATPQMFRQKAAIFEPDTLERFMTFYVHGLYNLCKALSGRGCNTVDVYYPSSVAVEERPPEMTEYAIAKASGEILCAGLPHMFRGFKAMVQRLPRLQTDQTATLVPQTSTEATEVLLPAFRSLKS